MVYQAITDSFNPAGLDLRRTSITRNVGSSTGGKNYTRTQSGHLVKRKGYNMKADDVGGYGLTVYEKRTLTEPTSSGFGNSLFGVDPFGDPRFQSTGITEKVLINLNDTPSQWTKATLTITYTGAGVATCDILSDSDNKIHLKLYVDSVEVLDNDCGTGQEGSPDLISDLITAISAVSDFTASSTGDTSQPSAALDFKKDLSVSGDIEYGYWTDLNIPGSAFQNLSSRRNRADFENPSTVSINGILLIANGRDDLKKYDGQNLYNAGMPVGIQPTPAVNVASGNLNGTYFYKIQYSQKDAVGNVTNGAISAVSASVAPSSEKVDLTVTDVLAASNFNTGCAITDGVQTSTNISTGIERLTVDDSAGGDHTLLVGDIAYFYDINQSQYRELEVLAVTGTTIDLASDTTLSVADNQVISNNLRILVYRTVAGGTAIFNLVEEIPNDSFNSTQTYTDNTADGDLGGEFIEPIKTPAPPPKCKYIQVWDNQVVMSGNLDFPNRLYYSQFEDVVSPESFPAENFIEGGWGKGGPIKGLGRIRRNLMIYHEDTTWIGEGNLASDQVRFNPVSLETGCVSHHTIKNLENSVYWLSKEGVYKFDGSNLERISTSIDPIFMPEVQTDFSPYYLRATAAAMSAESKYFLYLPIEATNGSGDTYATTDSKVYVWDEIMGQWYAWDNINALGGVVPFEDDVGEELWFSSRETDANRTFRFNNSKSEYDFADHIAATTLEYPVQWFHGNRPSQDKQFHTLNLLSLYEGTESTLTALPTEANPYVYKNLKLNSKKSIRFKFNNSELNKQVVLTGWELTYTPYRVDIRR
jgi:hypothetical protein